MKYLCEVVGKDRVGNAKVKHLCSGIKIVLEGSKKLVKSDCLKIGQKVSCGDLKRGDNIYFSSRYLTIGKEGGYIEQLKKQGEIRCILYDTSKREVLIVGIWNDIKRFEDFDELPLLIGRGNLDCFSYVAINPISIEELQRIFRLELRTRIVEREFQGLLGIVGRGDDDRNKESLFGLIGQYCQPRPYTPIPKIPEKH